METKFAIKLKSKEHKDNPYVIIKEKDVYNYIHTTLRPLTSDDIKNKIDTVSEAIKELQTKYPRLESLTEFSTDQMAFVKLQETIQVKEVRL
jgi:hypothetical protein